MMPLGNHLGAKQDLIFAAAESIKDIARSEFFAGDIRIEADGFAFGEKMIQSFLEPLSAGSPEAELGGAASGTRQRASLGSSAVMANHPVGGFVIGPANLAIGAFANPSAFK